jgi:hypothetical protein
MVQELHTASPTSTKTSNTSCLEKESLMPQIKTWKTRPAYAVILEILNKKGDMADDDLFAQLKDEYDDLGYKDFNDLLLRLEVTGKIRTSSMARGKRRIELVH